MDSVSEERLQQVLQEFAEGSEHGYEVLFRYFYNRLLLYGGTITSHQNIVEDQIQEVFIWLYHHPQKCRSVKNIEAYIYSALKKNILSSLRKEANRQVRCRHYIAYQDQATLGAEEQWVETDVQQQQHHWLSHQINQLSPCMKEVVYLRYYQCLGFEEIAGIMSVSPQVARNYAFRALKKMRQSIPQLQRLLSFAAACLLAG